jgi:hypothetical protein
MTFMAAGVRRFVCKNTMYCSIDGCSSLSHMIDLRCYSTTAIQILLSRGQKRGQFSTGMKTSMIISKLAMKLTKTHITTSACDSRQWCISD